MQTGSAAGSSSPYSKIESLLFYCPFFSKGYFNPQVSRQVKLSFTFRQISTLFDGLHHFLTEVILAKKVWRQYLSTREWKLN